MTRDGNGYAAKEFWLMANRQVLATAQLAKTANISPPKYVTFEAEKHDKQVYTISYELITPFSPRYLMYFELISCFLNMTFYQYWQLVEYTMAHIVSHFS